MRTVNISTDVQKFEDFLCATAPDSQPVIRVEFHRLSELLAVAAVGGVSSLRLEGIFGSVKIIENNVFTLYRRLVQEFGQTATVGTSMGAGVGIRHPADNLSPNRLDLSERRERNTSLDANDASLFASHGKTITLTALTSSVHVGRELETKQIYNTRELPAGYKAFYFEYTSDSGESGALAVWRWLDKSLLDRFVKETVGRKWQNKPLQLLKFITQETVPDKFVVLMATLVDQRQVEECGGFSQARPWSGVSLLIPEIELDVVVVTNVAPHPIRIDALLGRAIEDVRLRHASLDRRGNSAPSKISSETQVLGVGGKIVVPVGITLAAPKEVNVIEAERVASQRIYEAIQQTPGGTVFEFGPAGNKIKKTRESLPSPDYPEVSDYRYGPALDIQAIVVDGKNIALAESPTNYLQLTVSSERGCCPYLLAFDPQLREWVSNGKILHSAFGRDHERSETIQISGLKTRFKIEEREPEIVFVKSAQLFLGLNDGKTVILNPDQIRLRTNGRSYARARFGQAIPISFTLPPGIGEADVERAELTVSAYYEREQQNPRVAEVDRVPQAHYLKRVFRSVQPPPSH